ncbi:MAG: M56 family metallopeptidase [Eubacteriales bacterium]
MENVFLAVLNMSLTASYIIPFVLLARMLLQKVPKIYSYSLWSVVLFRLLCPFSLESAISLLPEEAEPITRSTLIAQNPEISTGIPIIDQSINPILPPAPPPETGNSVNPLQIWTFVAQMLWGFGIVLMLLVASVSLLLLKKKLRVSKELEKGVFLADDITSPFVFGVISPKIYLPSSINEEEIPLILAHERFHLKRFDHITRLLSFVALTLHWFNPLVWISYYLSEKDMETSCDEGVLREKSLGERGDYATALLKFTGRRTSLTPLAFSENDTKGRVKNIMKMKKTKLWVSGLACMLVVGLVVGFATNRENAQYDTEFASFTIDSFLKSVYLKENSPELKKAQEEGLLPYYAYYPEHGSMYMTYELLPNKSKGTVTAENFKDLQISETVNELSTELFTLYYPHILYSVKNSVVGDTKKIEPVNYEYQGEQGGTVTVGTVDLEISPIDLFQGMSRDELDAIFANLSTTYEDEVELRNAYLTEVLTMLLKNFSKVEYKNPVSYEANIGFYKIEKHLEYAMIDGKDGEYHFTKLLYTLFDFQGKY